MSPQLVRAHEYNGLVIPVFPNSWLLKSFCLLFLNGLSVAENPIGPYSLSCAPFEFLH